MENRSHVGVDSIYPDFTSLRECHYAPNHASVMCFISEANVGYERDPRTLLSTVLASAPHLRFKIGFEVEFRCLTAEGKDLDDTLYSWWTSTGLRNRCAPIIDDIVRILQRENIEVLHYCSESGLGMFEIATGPLSPLESIDAWVFTREAVKSVFWQHGIIATMYPSPVEAHTGIGAHFHLSMVSDMEVDENTFLAGMLDRLGGLCAFAMPLEDSYKRVTDSKSEAGCWIGWGTENRDFPIRKVKKGHWEVRCCDATANLYLVVSAFLSAGLAGLRTRKQLTYQDFNGNPVTLDEPTRKGLGIMQRMPADLAESLEELRGWDTDIMSKCVETFCAMKKQEIRDLRELSPEERMRYMIRHF
ncbi:hypothetical protein BJY01DRAFT_231023 [Aspergillus pseudoustus]|uniref:GS catalytic domain-containing protein n=1 Tax=Aspergillus pseudoustus TaxID=1810923 RepID=A0ABR4KYA6_9EURO